MPNVKPFAIAIWCGVGKPQNLNEFLHSFVEEVDHILNFGIECNGFYLRIDRIIFISDAPARALLKGVFMS